MPSFSRDSARVRPNLLRLLAGLGALLVLGALFVSPALAEQRTVVWQGDFTVPVLQKTVIGTLTTNFDTATNSGTWSFQGTVDGKLATANGRGTFSGDSSSITLTVTSIENWQMPGLPRPPVPSNTSIRLVGGLAYVSYSGDLVKFAGLPVAISAPLSFPPESGTYVLSNPGTGAEKIDTLPKAGIGNVAIATDSGASLNLVMVLTGGLTVFGLAAAWWLTRNHQRRSLGKSFR